MKRREEGQLLYWYFNGNQCFGMKVTAPIWCEGFVLEQGTHVAAQITVWRSISVMETHVVFRLMVRCSAPLFRDVIRGREPCTEDTTHLCGRAGICSALATLYYKLQNFDETQRSVMVYFDPSLFYPKTTISSSTISFFPLMSLRWSCVGAGGCLLRIACLMYCMI